MKRHNALQPLSRDHHSSLILAQLLKRGAPEYKGMPVTTEARADYARLYYRDDLLAHFLLEEETVIKLIKGINGELDELCEEIITEHKTLRALFETISSTPDLQTHLDKLGHALEQHIRKEERIFFPMIQELCNEEQLIEIEKVLSA